MKLPGDEAAGPIGLDVAETLGEVDSISRSGDTFRELALELFAESELSGISVNPNNLGRRPRRCAILSESAAISRFRLGGDRTSGRTCIAVR